MEDKRYYSDAGPENLNLMGDLVLVKPEQQEFEGRIYIPPSARPERGEMLHGEVVACGPGDRLIPILCLNCTEERYLMLGKLLPSCHCSCPDWRILRGEKEGRRALGVKVGDKVLYWRSPANQVTLQGIQYELIHEEQSVVAVLEA